MTFPSGDLASHRGSDARRTAVLDAALSVFGRFGFQKTSMADIAVAAHISRPGLYFLFDAKGALFSAAVERAIELDLRAVDDVLRDSARPLADRVLDAFDRWAGRYIGPLSDVATLVESNPGMIPDSVAASPDRFFQMLVGALRELPRREVRPVARTLVSVSIGIKHQVHSREEYRSRMRDAIRILLPTH